MSSDIDEAIDAAVVILARQVQLLRKGRNPKSKEPLSQSLCN